MSELALDQRNLESETSSESSQETENLPSEEGRLNDANSVPESLNPVARFVEQPAVKRALPAIIGGVAIWFAFFSIFGLVRLDNGRYIQE